MNPQRLATMSTAFQTVALPACVAAWIAAFGPPVIQRSGVTPFINHFAPSLAANAAFAVTPQTVAPDKPQAFAADLPQAAAADKPPTLAASEPQAIAADEPHAVTISNAEVTISKADAAIGNADAAINNANVATASEAVKVKEAAPADAAPASQQTDTAPASTDQKPIVTAALTDTSEVLPTQAPPVPAATAGTVNPAARDITRAVDSVETLDECYVVDRCIERYLWALYERTPKDDSIKQEDRRKVTVKRKGKLVTVTRTFTTVVDEDFAWKDPKAADKAGMSMTDYVIRGMDQSFRLKLFRMLLAAEQAGLSPGITSAFRDDYRQSIASGLKAASSRSYHGGSFRGGYGHGLAADVVSTRGDTRAQRLASSDILWKWIDTHGPEFGVARPYLDHDPPHVGPTDGQEYASHFRGKRARAAATDAKKRTSDDRGRTRHRNTSRSSRQKTT
jgi:hypothetical protein